jgi:glycosyltransferase involved in cell wall biosynthesis
VPPEISIIVPVFNEEGNVLPLAQEVAEAFSTVSRPFELVFVDDASTDATWERIRQARVVDSRVRGVRHERNSGQSAAVWTGLCQSTGPIVGTLDGDRQNDPADLPRLLEALAEVDFACGVRVKREDTWVRRVSSKIARSARRLVLGIDFQDTGCALRMFRRSAIEGLVPFNGWHRFLPVLVAAAGVRTRELPAGHRPRVEGVSKYGVWNRVWRGLYDLVGVGWYLKRRIGRVPVRRIEDD